MTEVRLPPARPLKGRPGGSRQGCRRRTSSLVLQNSTRQRDGKQMSSPTEITISFSARDVMVSTQGEISHVNATFCTESRSRSFVRNPAAKLRVPLSAAPNDMSAAANRSYTTAASNEVEII